MKTAKDRLSQILTVRLNQETMDSLAGLASLHDCNIAEYVREILIRVVGNSASYVMFICDPCKKSEHDKCSGTIIQTHCDCQHRIQK